MVGVTERQSDRDERYFLPKWIVFPDKKPTPAAGGLLTDCQKSLAEFAARRPRIRFHPFFAAAPPKGTSVGRVRREKYFALASAQRNWPRQTRRLMSGQSVFSRILCVKTRGSERKLFCQKRAPPFFDKLKNERLPPLIFYAYFHWNVTMP